MVVVGLMWSGAWARGRRVLEAGLKEHKWGGGKEAGVNRGVRGSTTFKMEMRV